VYGCGRAFWALLLETIMAVRLRLAGVAVGSLRTAGVPDLIARRRPLAAAVPTPARHQQLLSARGHLRPERHPSRGRSVGECAAAVRGLEGIAGHSSAQPDLIDAYKTRCR